MNIIKRVDLLSISDVSKTQITEEGFLKTNIFATRTGIFEYLLPDGSVRRELRPAEEVFDSESLASITGKPITLKHPEDFVNSENAKFLTVGFTGENPVIKNKEFIDLNTTIIDKSSIEKILSGEMSEVSCGYTAELEFTPGEYQGRYYDAIQRNIRYNHVAIVDLGRAGPEARFRFDSKTSVSFNKDYKYKIHFDKGEEKMKITLNGKEFEVEKELADAINGELSVQKNDSAELEKVKGERDSFQAFFDAQKEENEKLVAENKSLKEKADSIDISELVKERKEIEDVASKIISSDEIEASIKLDNLELKKAVIATVSPSLDLTEKSSVYIDARFDAIAENVDAHSDGLKKVIESKEEKVEIKIDARDRAIMESRDLYKKPLSVTRE